LLAQTSYLIPLGTGSATFTTCNGVFYDGGGAGANHGQNQNSKITFVPGSPNASIKVNFTQFLVDPLATLTVYDGLDENATPIAIFNSNITPIGLHIAATTANTSGAITFVFTSGAGDALGWVADITCGYPCQPFTVQLNNQLLSHPIEDSFFTKVCPSDLVTFGAEAIFLNNNVNYLQTQSNTKFIWKLDYLAPDTNAILHKTFFQPMIKNYSLRAVDVNGCSSSNVFKGIIMVSGTPIISINPYIIASISTPLEVTANETEDATLLFQPVELSTDILALNFINYDTVFLPDGNNISYIDNIFVGSFSENQLLETIDQLKSINLNMEHSFLGDLSIRITCPNGQNALLKSFNVGNPVMTGIVANACSSGGGSINLGAVTDAGTASPCFLAPGVGWDYQFKPGATGCFGSGGPTIGYLYVNACGDTFTGPSLFPSIENSYTNTITTPVFYGSYQNLSSLIGCPLNGNWRITVTDHLSIDNGYIFNWGIEFDESLQIDTMFYTVNVDSARWTGQNVTPTGPFSATIFNNNPGISNYTVTLIDEFGCEYDADFSVNTVLGVDDFDNTKSPIKFYPNPASYFVNGSSTHTDWNNSTLELFDQSGKLLQTVVMSDSSIQIDLSNYAVGQYYIKSTNRNNSSHTVKIVVIR
jgi:subtilisin-like proprotein convertase family protein